MPGADFRIDVKGLAAIERELAARAARYGDLHPLMDDIGVILETDTLDNFKGEHDPDGVPWLPSIRVQEHGGKTLQLSRRLYQSITHRADSNSVEVGTNVAYAGRHQEGFRGTEQVASHKRTMRQVFGVKLREPIEVIVPEFSRKANTPKRAFLGMSAAAREDIVDAVEHFAGPDA